MKSTIFCLIFTMLILSRSPGLIFKHFRKIKFSPLVPASSLSSRSPVSLYSSSSSSSTPSSSSIFSKSSSNNNTSKKLDDFRKLVNEIIQLVMNTGVKMGVTRSVQLVNASIKLTQEIVNNPQKYTDKKSNNLSIPKLLRRLFEELGATYIKLGQFIASSPTLFPAEYVLEFQSCLDKTPTVPFSDIKQIIQSEFKKPITEIYSYIDPKPLASASIAQVHLARLRNGTEVCIKVQKPGVDTTLIADLNFLTAATKILEFINPDFSRVSLANIVSDIKDSMIDELNFEKEARNLVNFREFLARNNIVDAVAPMPYLTLTSKRVLTMEYLKGVPLVDLEGIKRYSKNPELTLISALQTWGLSVTENDIFHADLHGGNLLVLEDGRVGFIDFGIVGRIPERVWNGLGGLVEGLIDNDFQKVANALVQMGATSDAVNIDEFAKEVESVFNKISQFQPEVIITSDGRSSAVSAQMNVDDRETTELVLELVAVADRNGLRLPREFGFLLKQGLYFDRYQKLLAPDIDPLRDSRVRDSFSSFSSSSRSNTVTSSSSSNNSNNGFTSRRNSTFSDSTISKNVPRIIDAEIIE